MNESEEPKHNFMIDHAFEKSNPLKLNCYSRNGTYHIPAWLDVKVIFIRISFGRLLDESPAALIMRFPQRSIDTSLEVNGGRISPSEETSLVLRRDRVDTDSGEVIYVTTDKLRAFGSITFEVYEDEEPLVGGILSKTDISVIQATVGYDTENLLSKATNSEWIMECNSIVRFPACTFLKRTQDYASVSHATPALEICVVGHYSSLPVILTQTVELAARRRTIRHGTLDVIPEDKECGAAQNMDLSDLDAQSAKGGAYEDLGGKTTEVSKYFGSEPGATYLQGDGDISWFNAGVRVGVGIGLGLCLGIGIGVGILVRAYQVTTRSFRKHLF